MTGLNNIREAYGQMYAQMNEKMDPEERELRRQEVADKKASRMSSSVASKYAGSEAQSAARADKKSRGKHIHGMADSYEVEGEIVDEAARKPSQIAKTQKLSGLLKQIQDKNEKARKEMIGTQAHKDMVKAASRHFEEVEISEGPLDPTEKKQKEKIVKALKTKASDFKARYGKRWKNVMYATATTQAQRSMDTRHSDRRYGVEK